MTAQHPIYRTMIRGHEKRTQWAVSTCWKCRQLCDRDALIRFSGNHGACKKARAHTAGRPYQILDVFPARRGGPLCPPDHPRRITSAKRGVAPHAPVNRQSHIRCALVLSARGMKRGYGIPRICAMMSGIKQPTRHTTPPFDSKPAPQPDPVCRADSHICAGYA